MGIASSIALSILGNLATDLVRSAAGQQIEPLNEAIQSTANSFPDIDGLRETLQRWLQSPSVAEAIGKYVQGDSTRGELPLATLASDLIEDAGFYLAEHSHATAEKILTTFLAKVRAAYLVSPIGTLHIANRQEASFDGLTQQVQHLTAMVESAGGLKTALQTHFDQATARMESGDYPGAKTLFESLLSEIEQSPVRDRTLERQCHASLAKTLANLVENERAAWHYKQAAALDGDSVRATVNAAMADLCENNAQAALGKLENVVNADSSSAQFEFSAARVGALLRLKRHDEALSLARAIKTPGKEARRLELIALAHREAGNLGEAERAYREALTHDSARPELHYALAELLFLPAIEFRNANPGTPLSTEMAARLNEAGEHLTTASDRFRQQGRNRAVGEIASALGVVRMLQDRLQETISLLEPVVKTPDATANDWRTLAYAFACTNQAVKAADAFRAAATLRDDPNTQFMLTHSLVMAGRPEDALAIASSKATEPITVDNVKWHVTSRLLKNHS